MNRFFAWPAMVLILGMSTCGPVGAVNLVWDDNGNDASKEWSITNNWDPNNLPDAADDLFIGVDTGGANVANAANDVTIVDQNFTVASITLGNGADIVNSTDGGTTTKQIVVNTSVTVGNGTGTSVITLYDAPGTTLDSLNTYTMSIGSGGQVILDSDNSAGDLAILEVDNGLLDINTGGTLSGNGLVELTHFLLVATTLLENDGTLTAGSSLSIPPPTTLQITAGIVLARIDLDGVSGSGTVNVNRNATLDIDVTVGDDAAPDAFGGAMNLQEGATLDIAGAWSFGGTMNVNTPSIAGSAGAAAHLAGGAITMTGGTITLADNLDSLEIDAAFTGSFGVIDNSGLIIFNAATTIQAGVDFNMNGDDASLTVNSTVNIDTPDFNLDGGGMVDSVTTINAGGNLDLDLGAGADEDFGHTINLNGGLLNVTTADNNWSLNGLGVINAGGAATSNINGETFQIAGMGSVNVAAGSQLNVNTVTEITSGTDFIIAATGALVFGTVTYGSATATYTGDGIMRPGGATIAAPTTWEVAIVDLDWGAISVNADLTIMANSIDDAGDGFDGTITIADTALLAVTIGGGGTWTVDPAGSIIYNGDASDSTFLAGSNIILNGGLNVTGDGRTDAVLNIGSTGVVNINAPGLPLRLSGGNTTTNTNTIAGGTINGVLGVLGADNGSALVGFGTIDPTVDFDDNSNLQADNGTLNVNTIADVGTIGTADSDGVLNVGPAWNTNVAQLVDLNGGTLQGGTIINDNTLGINGNGTVSARVFNNMSINAENDGLLIVQTAGNNNDWDGTTNAGDLTATAGDLEIRDNAAFLFHGTVYAFDNHEVFASGFELEFEPASSMLILDAGTYRSTHATDIGGNVEVNNMFGVPSTLRIDGATIFESTSNTMLTGDLQLDNSATQIDLGAMFGGGGALINMPGRTLTLAGGANVNVELENQGTLVLGLSIGHTQGFDFEQTDAGAWNVELGGTGISDFDRMALTGLAALDGTLNLSLISGYVPTLADPVLTILTASSVGGTFDTIMQPVGMPAGLMFEVVYNPTNVQLIVAGLLLGDYNRNGTVDAADHVLWRATLGDPVTPFDGADGDGDGMVDNDDYGVWVAHFGQTAGSGSAVGQSPAVPEPGAALLALVATIGGLMVRQPRLALGN